MRSITLVDPDLDALASLASELRARGLTVAVYDDVGSAFDRFGRQPPDAVLVAAPLAELATRLRAATPSVARVPCFTLVDALGAGLSGDELVRDAESIAKRVLSLGARKSSPDSLDRGDFRGDLAQVSLPDLLQLLGANRRTGSLNLATSAGAGEVRFVEGEIVDAVYRRLEGEKALFRLFGESEGSFAFVTSSPSPHRRVQVPTHLLLMEGLRQLDESRRLRGSLGLDDQALVATALPNDSDTETSRRVLELLASPRSVDELLDDVPSADLDALDALARLLDGGRVRRVPRSALRVALGDAEQLALLGARVKRKARGGFQEPARLALWATPPELGLLMHAVRRLHDATAPAESIPAAPVPHVLATLRLTEGVAIDVLGVPAIEAYAPLWSLALPGSIGAVCFAPPSRALSELADVAGITLIAAREVGAPIDAADPTELAQLLRAALDAAGA